MFKSIDLGDVRQPRKNRDSNRADAGHASTMLGTAICAADSAAEQLEHHRDSGKAGDGHSERISRSRRLGG